MLFDLLFREFLGKGNIAIDFNNKLHSPLSYSEILKRYFFFMLELSKKIP